MPYRVKVKLIGLLLRIFSFVYHLPVAIFLFALGVFAILDNAKNLKFPLLPWTGMPLAYWMAGIGLIGLLSIILAILRRARILFVLYALCLLGLMLNAFLGRTYDGMDEFRTMAWLTFGALIALAGAITHARSR
jgi:hypothetical protein